MIIASAFIVEVPNVSASKLLDILRDVVPAEVTIALQHLRRFAKPEFLPHHLHGEHNDCHESDVSETSKSVTSTRQAKSTTSHVLICPVHAVSYATIAQLFENNLALFRPLEAVIRETAVPVFAPTSAIQAAEWSAKYWPTIYKNTNPYGPHPAMVRRAELELLANDDAHRYMGIARQAAEATSCKTIGMPVGAVIVERVPNTKETRIVSAAGDARFLGVIDGEDMSENTTRSGYQNIMGHSVLRAIAMVAQKRRMVAELEDEDPSTRNLDVTCIEPNAEAEPDLSTFSSSPLTEIEHQYCIGSDNLSPNGYLCLDLEIYLTHEPCVMCAMAILHSRFARVVFGKRMLKTGALSAEKDSLGYGMFWQEQLNWKFLAWQWSSSCSPEHDQSDINKDFHA